MFRSAMSTALIMTSLNSLLLLCLCSIPFNSLPRAPRQYSWIMAAFIGKKAAKKLFAQHLEKYTPEDPLYEFYTNEHGKQKRRKVNLFILCVVKPHLLIRAVAPIAAWSLCSWCGYPPLRKKACPLSRQRVFSLWHAIWMDFHHRTRTDCRRCSQRLPQLPSRRTQSPKGWPSRLAYWPNVVQQCCQCRHWFRARRWRPFFGSL